MTTLAREVTTFAISGGAEMAQCGWWWFSPSATGLADLNDDLVVVHAGAYWWENSTVVDARTWYSGQVVMSSRELQLIDQITGNVIQTMQADLPASPSGASVSGQLPAEVATVVSVRSGFAERNGNGRFYLPPPATDAMTAQGNYLGAFQDNQVRAFGAYFDAVQFQPGGFHLGTWSQPTNAFTPAQSINVGSIPDSQRRRRNKLTEARYHYPLA